MKLQHNPPLHLTYCMNVHPGETWEENFEAVRSQALAVKRHLNRPGPFGLGLRLSRTAAETLQDPVKIEAFRHFCRVNDLYVFTINGFPYGCFHEVPVKVDVYRPDWRCRERLDYTILLIDILAALLPPGINGSISTVPGSYREWIAGTADVRNMVEHIVTAADHAAEVYARTGKKIVIALEPEPDGWIENTREAIEFYNGPLQDFGTARLRRRGSGSRTEAEGIIRNHVGICFDTAHMAMAFENLADSLSDLRRAGVTIGKIHFGTALELRPGADARSSLAEFCEDVYLHQTRRRKTDGEIRAFADLPEALATPGDPEEQWRVHFHLPLHFEGKDDLISTRFLLNNRFVEMIRQGAAEHLEIETYTYKVMPAGLAPVDITREIAREYDWLLDRILSIRSPA